MAPVLIASLLLQVLLTILQRRFPPVRPERIWKDLSLVVELSAIVCTFVRVSIYRTAVPGGPLLVAVVLVALALIAPCVGWLESRFRKNGQSIYSANRFRGHILTNALGAIAASLLVWVAHSTNGFDEFVAKLPDHAAFNIMLPLSAAVVFSFVRWQQVHECPDLDQRAREDPASEDKIAGSSLRNWHQLINVIYLIAATFAATTTVLYLFAYAMVEAKAGHPLAVSWQVILTIVLSLSVLYACGSPGSREHRAVYLTFLTGTPVALGAVLVWLSWFSESALRNIAAASIAGIGYGLYCWEAVRGTGVHGEKLQLHYFSAAVIAVALVLLLGALYLS
ncbi:MAG TPA: hypothetical protein VGH59_03610 [Casimicrobiaceae bacterium]